MRVEVVQVTPQMARDWLYRSADQRQRSLSTQRVDRIAHDIITGQWKMTHQPVALDTEGIVIDGQHRLAAVGKAKTAVQMLVAYDADPNTFDVIDTGAARTPADTLRIAGYANSAHVAASARMLLAYDEVKGTNRTFAAVTRLISTTDVVKLIESDRGDELLDSIPYASQIAGQWGRYGTKAWLAAAIQILKDAGVPKPTVSNYCERLKDGAMLKPGSPILAMRRYIMSDTGLVKVQGGHRATVGVGMFIKTFNRHHVGDDSVRLATFKPTIERMPFVVPVGGDLSQERGLTATIEDDEPAATLEDAAAS
jgi:hypothetical protein